MGRRPRGQKIKYRYKGKEELHAKLVFGEMTLEDVLKVVWCPGYEPAREVHVTLDDDPEGVEYNFRTKDDELHTFKKKFRYSWEKLGPTLLWFKLGQRVRVYGNTVEARVLKGTRKKRARLKFMISRGPNRVAIDILERTMPEET